MKKYDKMVKSEEVSIYTGYWYCEDGRIIERKTGTVMPVYSNGCVRLQPMDRKNKESTPAHRLIAYAFIPNPTRCKFVTFKDGDPENRRADNLEWARSIKPISETTREIVAMRLAGASTSEIAYRFEKTPQYVNRLLKDQRQYFPNL